jgi:hypothetical protein
VGSLLHSSLVSGSYDILMVLDLLQSLFLHDLLLCFLDCLHVVYYNEDLDYTVTTGYCTVVVLHTVVQGYTAVSLENVAHYTLVVLQISLRDCTMDAVYIFLLHVHPAPCMYLQSFLSSFPRFYSPWLCVQLTYKICKMYSSELSSTSASRGNDRDHAHVFCKSRTMVLLKPKGLAYPIRYIVKIMDTHSCDDLMSCTLYTKHLLFSPFLCFDLTGMLISSDLALALLELDLYACIGFPLAVRMLVGPHPNFGIFVFSKDTSSVATKN